MRFLIFLIVFLLSSFSAASEPRDVIPLRSGRPLTQQMNRSGVVYRISRNIDLKGGVLVVPEDCILNFDGGAVTNGTIVGNNTEILGPARVIFDNLNFTGTFRNETVRSEWFRFKGGKSDNRKVFDALMALAASQCHTDVYIQEGTYYTSVGAHGHGIRIPDNTSVHNSADIHALPSSLEKYDIISICDVENVLFEGGRIYGDVGTHIGETGEWGYGIGMTGARNCTVKNVYISRCWGDGINVQALYDDYLNRSTVGHCYDIIIENVVCDDNRRQGMSIEGCIGISVRNSKFMNTGKTQSTLPSAGIDIEPWFDTEVVSNVQITGCVFENNKGGNLMCPLTHNQWNLQKCQGFHIEGNCFDDNAVRLNRTRNVKFLNNEVGRRHGLLEFNQYSDVSIESNKINGTVSFYTEGDSENGVFRKNIVKGGKKLNMAVGCIDDNVIEGLVCLSEGISCILSDNEIDTGNMTFDTDYSFVCDNTSVEMYGNVFRLVSPMIFRYRSSMDIHDNSFIALAPIRPACMILQTARNRNMNVDGRICSNSFQNISNPIVDYSANGKYILDDNVIINI